MKRCLVLATSLVFIIVSGANGDLQDGIVAYWPLDGDFEDKVGDNHGTFRGRGDEEFDDGVFGGAIDLDGGNQYIQIDNEENFDFVGQDFSISAWFRVDAFTKNWQALIAKGEGNRWRVHRRGGESIMTWNGGNADVPADANPPVDDDEIHHFAGVSIDGVEVQMYIDGELVSVGPAPTVENNNQRVAIGENPDARGRTWDGLIDDVAIWGRALEEEEIEQIWEGGGNNTSLGDLIGVGQDPCDFDGDGILGIGDINAMSAEIQSGNHNPAFDLTADGLVNDADLTTFVTSEDKLHTWVGDADLNGEFNSTDIVIVFQAGLFETNQPATWAEGDWDGDGVFSSSDIVVAFQDGGFEVGPRWTAATASVPEPSSLILLGMGMMIVVARKRRK